ncbi:MAG: hypothetical protein F4X32_05080 [Candidatus Dadabacteria bacterium]|nr:hypothetical protein [Candidatus Dadabacteria bacterium]MYB26861.1 hypothetical protein [Candidatus Dadabacteria bacterium]
MRIIVFAILIFIPLWLIHHGRRRWGACILGIYLIATYLRDPGAVLAVFFTILIVLGMYWTVTAQDV